MAKTKAKTNGSKAPAVIACIVSVIMTFSIFMFFMDPITWKESSEIATPSFFDVMFGGGGSKQFDSTYLMNIGMLIIFIIQLLVIIGCIVSLILVKKDNKKVAFLLLAFVGVLGIVAGILTLCCSNFNISWIQHTPFFDGVINLKEFIKLGAGAYVYGITMLVAGLGAFLPYTIKYCLKK